MSQVVPRYFHNDNNNNIIIIIIMMTPVRGLSSPIWRVPRWRIGECSADMQGRWGIKDHPRTKLTTKIHSASALEQTAVKSAAVHLLSDSKLWILEFDLPPKINRLSYNNSGYIKNFLVLFFVFWRKKIF